MFSLLLAVNFWPEFPGSLSGFLSEKNPESGLLTREVMICAAIKVDPAIYFEGEKNFDCSLEGWALVLVIALVAFAAFQILIGQFKFAIGVRGQVSCKDQSIQNELLCLRLGTSYCRRCNIFPCIL